MTASQMDFYVSGNPSSGYVRSPGHGLAWRLGASGPIGSEVLVLWYGNKVIFKL